MLEQVLAGDSIRLRNLDGIRDYCYVGDLADAIWRAPGRLDGSHVQHRLRPWHHGR
jgi:hypothetical protein